MEKVWTKLTVHESSNESSSAQNRRKLSKYHWSRSNDYLDRVINKQDHSRIIESHQGSVIDSQDRVKVTNNHFIYITVEQDRWKVMESHWGRVIGSQDHVAVANSHRDHVIAIQNRLRVIDNSVGYVSNSQTRLKFMAHRGGRVIGR